MDAHDGQASMLFVEYGAHALNEIASAEPVVFWIKLSVLVMISHVMAKVLVENRAPFI